MKSTKMKETITNVWKKIRSYIAVIGTTIIATLLTVLHYNRRANDKDRADVRQAGQTYRELKRRDKELQSSIEEVRSDYKETKSIIEDIRSNIRNDNSD